MTPSITIEKKFTAYPFAHRQPKHAGHCSLIHGHNWNFNICFGAHEMDECGFVLDFGHMGFIKTWLAAKFDHTLVLNEDDPLLADKDMCSLLHRYSKVVMVPDCSCEGLARFVGEELQALVDKYTNGRVFVCWVEVEEDEKNSATYVLDVVEGGDHE